MRKWLAALAAFALLTVPPVPAIAAPVPAKPAKPEKPKKDKDMSFEERLAAGRIVFTGTPMTPLTAAQLTQYDIIRDIPMERAAADILRRLIAVHRGPRLVELSFFVIDGDDFNCTTLATGGAILCTRAVFEQLVAAGMAGKDQLAFLLAHELAHVTIANHRERFGKTDKLKQDIAKAGVIAALVGLAVFSEYRKEGNRITMTATARAGNVFWMALGTGLNMSEFATGLAAPSWAKQDEEEADAYAMILMRDANFELHGAAQFLKTTDRSLREQGMRSTVFGSILKSAGENAVLQGLLNKGDLLSMAVGAVGGALAGWSQEGAHAHYHRAPDKRAAACAEFVKLHDAQLQATSGTNEAEELYAREDAAARPGAPTAIAAAPRRGTRTAAAPPIADSWETFLQEPGAIAEAFLSRHIRELLAKDRVPEAVALCQRRPTVGELALACGIAFAAAGDQAAAAPMLGYAMADPRASVETYRRVAQAQALMGNREAALATTSLGLARYPAGNLYPDEMMIRAASGDMTGAERTAMTCQQKASKEFQDACARGWAALQTTSKAG
jgi:predicted Zn-dependent protease